ncbi:hypothetical protein FOA52_010228 [Chlamydomonas sp. UWO 241]|nr:hypothetical protein FOA52_010228 [Chlamydomonas sp. UWO 241]
MEPPPDVLADIDLRFIRTAPKETLSSPEHLMFLVEHAYWFYEDHVREKDPRLRHYSKWHDFARLMFQSSPLLQPHLPDFDSHVERFRQYKRLIPVYGAILMDESMERVLLVRGMKSASGWGFPRGKVNAGEDEVVCAAREVLEETGVDVEDMIDRNSKILVTSEGKPHTLFIVTGLDPGTTVCAPKCKGEIGAYGWHYVKDLPATIDEANQVYLSSSGVKHRFFMVQPFVRPLHEWIRRRKSGKGKGSRSMKADTASIAAAAAAAPSAAALAQQTVQQAQQTAHQAQQAQAQAQAQAALAAPPPVAPLSAFRFDRAHIMAAFVVAS